MSGYRLVPAAEADIEEALAHTLTEYGFAKYEDYAALIHEALETLSANPRAGRRRRYIHPDAWAYRIERRADAHAMSFSTRSQTAFRTSTAFFYDGMDLPKRWSRRTGG